jgi:hypothetical protein
VSVGSFETRLDGDRRVCAACGSVVRGYRYRFHPVESDFYERCLGFAWCSGCRIYTGNMVYVPRDEVLVDALAHLPAEQREQLRRSERKLIDYLDRCAPDTT